MPYDEVLSKFSRGKLHSGSKQGPKVKNRNQALAIMMSEKREGEKGKKEYKSKNKKGIGPSDKFKKKFGIQ
jgi:hypothetical protein